jgi:hypothetical protein
MFVVTRRPIPRVPVVRPLQFAAPVNEQWAALRQVQEEIVPQLAASFANVMGELGSEASLTQLARAVRERNMRLVADALNLNILDEKITNASFDLLREAMAAAGNSQVQFIPQAAGSLSFDLLNPRAVTWLATNSAELVTAVNAQTVEALRFTLYRMFMDGIPPADAAKYMAEAVGLLPRHAIAVQNYRARLIAKGTQKDLAEDMAKEYAKRLLLYRGETIARTETIRASSMGQQLIWEDAIDNGYVLESTIWRKWLVTHDDRLSQKRCKPMTGQMRRMKEPFLTGEGKRVLTPPSGPNCRCAVGLVFED